MVLIGICISAVLIAALHLLLSRWSRREMARVAARRHITLPAPGMMTPEPASEAERQEERLRTLLAAIRQPVDTDDINPGSA